MNIRTLLLVFKVLLVLLLQVWVFNPLYLFRLATPFPYIYLLFFFPIGCSKIWITLWSGLIGLLLDIFSGTPGLHVAALTATGFLRNYLLRPYIDAETDFLNPPSIGSNGWGMALFLLELVALHHVLLFGLDALALFRIDYFLMRLGSSIVVSYLLALAAMLLFGHHRRNSSSLGNMH